MNPRIGQLGEKSLHAALKAYLYRAGDLLEHPVGGCVIDLVRPEPYTCIEVQTRALSRLKRKLRALLDDHPLRVVVPIAQERTILRVSAGGEVLARRKSPKCGGVPDVFADFVSIAPFALHPHFTLDVLLIGEEQVWVDDGKGSWRRRHWSLVDRRLTAVYAQHTFARPADYAALLPADLPRPFDTLALAKTLHVARRLAQKMAYCLRTLGVIEPAGKRGNAALYTRAVF